MNSFIWLLSSIVFSLILAEAPGVGRNPELSEKWEAGVEALTHMHAEVADGRLVSRQLDVLILSSMNYRETRHMLPAPDGDCRRTHRLAHLPSASWPNDYKPDLKMVCPVTGPMQINKGSARRLVRHREVQRAFPERKWAELSAQGKDPYKGDPLTAAQLSDPETNIRLGYAILERWKNACKGKDGSDTLPGVWMTAYRWGRCPPVRRDGTVYIDEEAKKRCSLVHMFISKLEGHLDETHARKTFRCTYDD